jgi:hypothetical protein
MVPATAETGVKKDCLDGSPHSVDLTEISFMAALLHESPQA